MTTDCRANDVSENFAILEDGTIIDKESGIKYDVLELIGEIEFYRDISRKFEKEDKALKQQLAEKDKEIDRIKQIAIDINRDNNKLRESLEEYSKVNIAAVLANRENKQYQNQKAIEELQKVFTVLSQNTMTQNAFVKEYIIDRIKELKGE